MKKILYVRAGGFTFLMNFVAVETVTKLKNSHRILLPMKTLPLPQTNFLILTKISLSGEGLNFPGRLSVLELQSVVLSAVPRDV